MPIKITKIMKTKIQLFVFLMLIFSCGSLIVNAQKNENIQMIRMSLQKRIPSDSVKGDYTLMNEIQEWNPNETAIIICDMWDKHWCKGASERVAEMAPFMNNVVTIAREKGVLIVHAPSSCMDYYKNAPARKLGQKYRSKKASRIISEANLASEKDAEWPIDQSDGGCDCSVECKQESPWTHQIDFIKIFDNDAISDSGAEISGLFNQKGIKNVILMGVHTNMCVIGRSFGLRNMVRMGMNVALMRDLTDTMYDSKQKPNVSHYTGTSLVNEYIETFVCPTMVSTDFTGQKQFRFNDDKRPVVAFIIAENEYHANQTLPKFAHHLLLTKGVNCEFALGKPVYEGEGIHNIENLKILQDADLAVIFARRRALPSEQMNLLKEFVTNEKPILGIRTASHAFNANQVVPNSGGGVAAAKGKVSDFLDQWPEFDKDVIGGNYKGHYPPLKVGIVFSVVPGMETHPLLRGVSPDGFVGTVAPINSLYQNRSLRSQNVQVLMLGSIPEQPSEPVLWINHLAKGNVVYTSMGHWEDWKMKDFQQIMDNAVDYLLNF
jgi:nicotinamidase-related amidase/type 1 glutamine amidotransferase